MAHKDKPKAVDLPQELGERLKALEVSDYFAYVEPLVDQVEGRIVAASQAGSSGFVLRFNDGRWVVPHLSGRRLLFQAGSGEPPSNLDTLLNSDDSGDANAPLAVDVPYAAEPCDIAAEVAKCHGLPVETLAVGENSFNFCFPGNMELQTMVVTDDKGRVALRVFWEQW